MKAITWHGKHDVRVERNTGPGGFSTRVMRSCV